MKPTIFIGSDHAGYGLKSVLLNYVKELGYAVEDCGTNDATTSVNYPLFALKVAHGVITHKDSLGILVCGTGIGISITANKIPGVRVALCSEATSSRLTKEHNNANIVALGDRVIGVELAKDVVKTFLETPYSNDQRHQKRLDIIDELDALSTITPDKLKALIDKHSAK